MSKTRVKIPEALRGAAKAARKARWEIVRTPGNHLKWIPPGGDFVITPATPCGGGRSVANSLGDLRKAGLEC